LVDLLELKRKIVAVDLEMAEDLLEESGKTAKRKMLSVGITRSGYEKRWEFQASKKRLWRMTKMTVNRLRMFAAHHVHMGEALSQLRGLSAHNMELVVHPRLAVKLSKLWIGCPNRLYLKCVSRGGFLEYYLAVATNEQGIKDDKLYFIMTAGTRRPVAAPQETASAQRGFLIRIDPYAQMKTITRLRNGI
jgi:hypothetical protein